MPPATSKHLPRTHKKNVYPCTESGKMWKAHRTCPIVPIDQREPAVTPDDQSTKSDERGPTFGAPEGVPPEIAKAFLQGLDDVRNGRTVSVEQTLAEGRLRIASHRAGNRLRQGHDPAVLHREPSIP